MARRLIVLFLLAAGVPSLWACSCRNNGPIQIGEYQNNAVFTARVIGLMGKSHVWKGKRYSRFAFALVKEHFWGLPWYWPGIVILDGDSMCNLIFADGEEYLVAGDRTRYGVIRADSCSRTQPLKRAQLDLRTLDGSHCSAPGGTVIGTLSRWLPATGTRQPYPGGQVTLTDGAGRSYSAMTDKYGVFELSHLPAGKYAFRAKLAGADDVEYGEVLVEVGVCREYSPNINTDTLKGRVLGLGQSLRSEWPAPVVELVPSDGGDAEPFVARIGEDGGFVFRDVPQGEYRLGVNLTMAPSASRPFSPTYYPGTTDPVKATRIRVGKDPISSPFNFAVTRRLPLAAVKVQPIFSDGKPVPAWYAELVAIQLDGRRGDSIDTTDNEGFGSLIGVAGCRYRIVVWEETPRFSPDSPTAKCSDPVEVDLRPGLAPVRVVLTHRCDAGR